MSTDLTQNFRIDPAELPGEAVIFGSTQAMREVWDRIDRVRSSDLPVLIQGESGTGKEVIARFLHVRSNRRDAPFVKLSCGAITGNLLESELFGCEKGFCRGVEADRPGLLEIAEGGTLLLDEVADMTWEMQGKLLRFLQHGSYTRFGGSKELHGRIRVICATKKDIKEAVNSGVFREDLFYRIEVNTLHLPALRDRKSDIPQLCEYFLQKLSRQFRRAIPRLNPATLQLLKQWDWHGNLRELENWIARAIILGGDEAVVAELRRQLEATQRLTGRRPRAGSLKEGSNRPDSTVASSLILKALQANRWNRRKTAEELNMSYRALLYRLRDAGIPQRRRSHRGRPPAH